MKMLALMVVMMMAVMDTAMTTLKMIKKLNIYEAEFKRGSTMRRTVA